MLSHHLAAHRLGRLRHFIEFAGEAIRSLSMEGRMTVCNMSIGVRGTGAAGDRTDRTFDYLRRARTCAAGKRSYRAVARWEALQAMPTPYSTKSSRFVPPTSPR